MRATEGGGRGPVCRLIGGKTLGCGTYIKVTCCCLKSVHAQRGGARVRAGAHLGWGLRFYMERFSRCEFLCACSHLLGAVSRQVAWAAAVGRHLQNVFRVAAPKTAATLERKRCKPCLDSLQVQGGLLKEAAHITFQHYNMHVRHALFRNPLHCLTAVVRMLREARLQLSGKIKLSNPYKRKYRRVCTKHEQGCPLCCCQRLKKPVLPRWCVTACHRCARSRC